MIEGHSSERAPESMPSVKGDQSKPIIFTIGHSTQSVENFLELLSRNEIDVLVDVRSYPKSKFAFQFDSLNLKHDLNRKKIKYLYLGQQLGGKPSDPSVYDEKGYASYSLIAQNPSFISAIQRLLNGALANRIAIMCTEENPQECHRHLLIGRILVGLGVRVIHIRANGHLQTYEELTQSELKSDPSIRQLILITNDLVEENWRSVKPIRSASQNELPGTSLKHSKMPG